MHLLCSLIPTAVVRGLQLGVGLTLAQKGIALVWFKDAKTGEIRDLWSAESLLLGLIAAAFILITVFPYEKLELPLSRDKLPVEDAAPSEDIGEEGSSHHTTGDVSLSSKGTCNATF